MSKESNRELVIAFLESQDALGKFHIELLRQKNISVRYIRYACTTYS